MAGVHDGPSSPLFRPVRLRGNVTWAALGATKGGESFRERVEHAPRGKCTSWGVPFEIDRPVLLGKDSYTAALEPFRARWLIFMHTTDASPLKPNQDGFVSPAKGYTNLREHVADYVMVYKDGTEVRCPIRRQHEIGAFERGWGQACFEAVGHRKPHSIPPGHEQPGLIQSWGRSQTRVDNPDMLSWTNWLWAWQNPHPEKAITALRFEPRRGPIVISAISAGDVASMPFRWERRQKAVLEAPKDTVFDATLDEKGLLRHIQLDLGQIISVTPRPLYPNKEWAKTYNNQLPKVSEHEWLVEYTAHPEACFHLWDGSRIPVETLVKQGRGNALTPIAPSHQRVRLRVLDRTSKQPLPVKLHVHGEAGEYLAPVDRHRVPNPAWYEDSAPEFLNQGVHWCTYIDGDATIDLPLGNVYIEVSKGFEIRPVRKVHRVTERTRDITILIEQTLPWREKGWVTADTHVHFLSPPTARLEGAAEGVNVVNLLASQWGELMTNAGDFDGHTIFGSREAGGDGEYLVRVGSENRQHILGHISLLGYQGRLIAPMTCGGPDESALGDPVDMLLLEWARQCHAQGGLVVLPHFPNPRAEHAAALIEGEIDAVEMTSWSNLYGGIDPYSLSDWYRYLNCGYFVPAVAGTDKMQATTPVGAVRTYAKLPPDTPFTYDAWMQAVRSGHTFVTYGPLLEFSVEGKSAGEWLRLPATGGTLSVEWETASLTTPVSRVELVVNGDIRESKTVSRSGASGHWPLAVDRSAWLAVLVRGKYPGKPEFIAAHSSPVMAQVAGTEFFAAADAVTILEQVEGALAYLDTLATRPADKVFKRMRMALVSAHRRLHNRMHQMGFTHAHTPATDHPEHH